MNYRDAALLNGSLDSLGESLLKNQMLQQQQQNQQQQRQIEQTRADTDQSFRTAQLQHYKNLEDKQDAANSQNLNRQDAQSAQALLSDIFKANAQGQFDADQVDNINDMLSQHPILSKIGVQISKPDAKQPTLSAAALTDKYAGTLEDQADDLQSQAASESDATSTQRQVMLQKVANLRSRAAALRGTDKQPTTALDPVTKARLDSVLGDRKAAGEAYIKATDPNDQLRLKAAMDQLDKKLSGFAPAQPAQPALATPAAGGGLPLPGVAAPQPKQVLDPGTAALFYKQAGGDKNLARKMALAAGFTIPQIGSGPAPAAPPVAPQ